MSTSIIDGTIEALDLKRSRAGLSIFNSIRFELADGSSRTITKQIVNSEVADHFAVGASGRFYLFSAFDMKGIHGFRSADGVSASTFPGGTNTKLFVVVGIVNLLWIALRIAVEGDVPLLGVGLLILAIVGFIFMSKGAREAKAQFDQDAGPVPIPQPVLATGA